MADREIKLARIRRETGLLYRIRDLQAACNGIYQMVQAAQENHYFDAMPATSKEYVAGVMRSVARVLAIEEGKQEADYVNFGISTKMLGTELQRKRPWRKKKPSQ